MTRRLMTRRLVLVTACALLAGACSASKAATTTTTAPRAITTTSTTRATTTTTTKPPLMPLTGLVAKPGQDPSRPVLGVKIENDPSFRPYAGFEGADVVYEEVVEGGYTRFLALFQSGDADLVGSIRSNRPVDPDLLIQYGKAMLACSGGNFTPELEDAGITVVTYDNGDPVFTERSDRSRPHHVYSNTTDIRDYVTKQFGDKLGPPPANLFTFGEPTGTVVATVDVPFASSPTEWQYTNGAWARFDANGDVWVTESGNQVTAANVVVQSVDEGPSAGIDPSGSPIPTWKVVGSGTVTVLSTGGKALQGTWSRPSLDTPTKYLDGEGKPIKLAPGNTWIELLPSDMSPVLS